MGPLWYNSTSLLNVCEYRIDLLLEGVFLKCTVLQYASFKTPTQRITHMRDVTRIGLKIIWDQLHPNQNVQKFPRISDEYKLSIQVSSKNMLVMN